MVITDKEHRNLVRHAQWIVTLVEGHSRDRKRVVEAMTPDCVKAVASAIRLAHHHGHIDEKWYRTRGRTIERMMAQRVAVRNKHQMISTGAGLFRHALSKIGHALKSAGHAITHSAVGQSIIRGAAGAAGDLLGGPLGGAAASALTKKLLPKPGGGPSSSSSSSAGAPKPAPPPPPPSRPPPSNSGAPPPLPSDGGGGDEF